ncbi:cortistatin-like [Microtus oregoni]|uniref:cortistatin-like n=1 Tax=Microtus oregoni TaxID=111838 RepID=UPI001BB1DBA1|nr:cortistatin-like [Microtus oregoni]XP_041507233.1 cortistatin-like [Microtus oregoni]
MGGCRARGQWLSAFGLLLLLWGAVATALPLERGPTSQDSGEAAEGKRASLLTFLAWWHGWTSQASSSALIGGDTSEVSRRQESPPLQQPPRRDKKPCKNFFWKTFSSCK